VLEGCCGACEGFPRSGGAMQCREGRPDESQGEAAALVRG
jgi:hypothetical protein